MFDERTFSLGIKLKPVSYLTLLCVDQGRSYKDTI